jgi:hypothetical protein
MSFRSIEDTLLELYDLYISKATLFACKRYFVDFYQATYDKLVGKS